MEKKSNTISVLVFTAYFWPENFKVNDLVAQMVSHGYDVDVLTGYPNYPTGDIYPEFQKNPEEYKVYCGARVFRLSTIPRKKSKFWLVASYVSYVFTAVCWSLLRGHSKRYDFCLVFLPSPIFPALPALLFARLNKVPIAAWLLDLWPETLFALGIAKKRPFKTIITSLCNFVYAKCDLLFCQSESFQKSIKGRVKNPDKVHILYSWADEGIAKCSDIPKKLLSPSKNVFTVTFTGNFGQAQDLVAVLKAINLARKSSNVRLLLVGDGRFREIVEMWVKKLDLDQNVIITGSLPPAMMPSIYEKSDALLLSLFKSDVFTKIIPAKLQSYLHAGKPILAMIDGEVADIINDSGSGMAVPSGDWVGLAQAINKILSLDQTELDKMSQNAAACYEDRFAKKKVFANFVRLVEDNLLRK